MRKLLVCAFLVFLAASSLPAQSRAGQSSSPQQLTRAGEFAYFFARADNDEPYSLWRSDGTAAGTTRLHDLQTTSPPPPMAVVNGTIYFGDGGELWKTDGTTFTRVRTFADKRVQPLGAARGRLIFNLYYGELWSSDGTDAGTQRLGNMNALASPPVNAPDGTLFFADHGPAVRTDGTPAGTVVLARTFDWVARRGDEVLAFDEGQLWRVDTAQPSLLASGIPISNTAPIVLGGELFLAGNVGENLAIYSSSGVQVAVLGRSTSSGLPPTVAVVGSTAYINGRVSGRPALFAFDGTRAQQVSSGSGLIGPSTLPGFAAGAAAGDLYVFPWGILGRDGIEPWRSDGTPEGTGLIRDLYPGYVLTSNGVVTNDSRPANFLSMGSFVLFTADDGVHGVELWRSDGTAAGTFMVKNINTEGSIAGRVVDANTSQPIAGAIVEAHRQDGNVFTHFVTATANANGEYVLEGLHDGTYALRTRMNNAYVDEVYPELTCPPCLVSTGTYVTIANEAALTGYDFRLTQGATIAGRVTANDGTALDSVEVRVTDLSDNVVASGITDVDGRYRTAPGLPAGSYRVRTVTTQPYVDELYENVACELSCATASATPVALTNGERQLDFALAPWPTMVIEIVDSVTGERIARDFQVQIFDAARRVYRITTAVGGTRELQLPDGVWYVGVGTSLSMYASTMYPSVACPPPASLGVCAQTMGEPVTIGNSETKKVVVTLKRIGASIEGRILNADGTPLAGASVATIPSGGSALSGQDGRYVIGGLAAGEYKVYATSTTAPVLPTMHPDVPCGATCTASTPGTVVRVATESVNRNVDIRMRAAGTISGTITHAGNPVTPATVALYDAQGNFVIEVAASAAGKYELPRILPGTYYLRVTPQAGLFQTVMYDGVACGQPCNPLVGKPIVIDYGTSVIADFALRRLPRVTGRVTDAATGAAIVGATVQTAHGSATTRADGTYELTFGQDGPVTLAARANGYVRRVHGGVECAECYDGTAVTLRFEENTVVDFALNRASVVAGRVVDVRSGAPMSNVNVTVTDVRGVTLGTARTDAAGNYRTAAIAGATSYAYASFSGYTTQYWKNADCPAPCATRPANATPLAVTGGGAMRADFALFPPGVPMTFRFYATGTGAPLAGAGVELYTRAGDRVAVSALSDATGVVTFEAAPGSYYVKTWNTAGYVDVLGSNRPCGVSCDLTADAALALAAGSTANLHLPRMAIASMHPANGPRAGGAEVMLRGGGFAAGATVKFGTSDATVLSVTSDTIFVRTPPGGTATAVQIIVTNPDGTQYIHPSAYEYVDTCRAVQLGGTQRILPDGRVALDIAVSGTSTVRWYRGRPGGLLVERGHGPSMIVSRESESVFYTARAIGDCSEVEVVFEVRPASGRRRAVR